jgi:hypothetical protein
MIPRASPRLGVRLVSGRRAAAVSRIVGVAAVHRWVVGLALVLWGCRETPPMCQADACRSEVQVTAEVWRFGYNNQADVLFVVDDSAGGPLGGALVEYLPRFMEPILGFSQPVDLHVGVITADLGAGGFAPPSCPRPRGDQGALQNRPGGATCGAASLLEPADRFLRLDECWEGFEEKSFAGTLGDAFGCYAAVPAVGCFVAQPLAALRAALEGCGSAAGCAQPLNEGFLRRDAYLQVVIITGQDDCSLPAGSTLFDPSRADLGPLTPYRCFEHEPQLTPVEGFAAFLKGLKPADPRMVYVSVIAGPPDPVVVGVDADGNPALQSSCTGGMAQGTPGIRLARFIGQFDADRAGYVSICAADLKEALAQAFTELAWILGVACLYAPPSDREPEVDGLQLDAAAAACRWVRADETWVEECETLPACDPPVCEPTLENGDCAAARHAIPDGAPGCWYVWRDEPACPLIDTYAPIRERHRVGSGYRFEVDWGGTATCAEHLPPLGTRVELQYVSCGADPAEDVYDCSPGCASLWPRCCPTPAPGCFP